VKKIIKMRDCSDNIKILPAKFALGFALGTAMFITMVHSSGASAEALYNFSIDTKVARRSLVEFADQAGLTLIVPYEIIEHKQGNAVKGRYSLRDAIQMLLMGTGLGATLEDNNQLTIYRLDNSTALPRRSERPNAVGAQYIEGSPKRLVQNHSLPDELSQDSKPNDFRLLEEINVTARRRSENLQSIPDTVVAFSEGQLERANVQNVRDITASVPNVSIIESLSPTSTYIIVRGISSMRNSEPAVAVLIDGVQVGSATELSQSYFDIETIELLKGPQGALYGRNALGGALLVTSKKPTQDYEGKFSTGFGEDGLLEVSGSFSGPLLGQGSDDLLFRLAGDYSTFDGNIVNEFLRQGHSMDLGVGAGDKPASHAMDFAKSHGFRAQVLWQPADSLAFDYRYSLNDIESGAMWYRNVYRMESDPNLSYEFPVNSNGNPTAIRTIDAHTLKIDVDLSAATLTSISNFTDTREHYGKAGETQGHDRTGNVLFYTAPFVNEFLEQLTNPIDQEFFRREMALVAAGSFVGSDQYYDIQTISQEFSVTGDISDSLNYIGGIYYIRTQRDDIIRATWEGPTGTSFDCEPTYEGGPKISDSDCNGLLFNTINQQDNDAWAIYLSTDYQLSADWVLTAAMRYDSDHREVTRIDGPTVDTMGLGVGSCDSSVDPDNCAVSGSKIENTFTAFQPKLSLAYVPSNDLTIYGTYAHGFRSGGFNASGALLTDTYEQENLDSYELGVKTTWQGGRLRANMAAFFQDYKNAQQFEFDGNVFVQSLYNIPKSEISGIEMSLEMAASENLTLSAGLGWMDSQITHFDATTLAHMESELAGRIANTDKLGPGTQEAFDRGFKGSHLPNFAHQSLNFTLEHELPLSRNNTLLTRIDYSHSGDVYWWIDGVDKQEDLGLLNGSINLYLSDDLELSLWCKNCTDVIYDSEYSPTERELFGGAAKDLAYRARGRTSGLQLNYSF